MAAHAPYIMPDGRMLASVLRAEAGSQETMRRKKRPTAAQGKLELFKQLEASKVRGKGGGGGWRLCV
jgi:hypothetical protein